MSYLSSVISVGFEGGQISDEVAINSTSNPIWAASGRYQIHAVHGFASLFGTPFSTEKELAEILGGRIDTPQQLIQSLSGTVTIFLYDSRERKYFAITDMYGAGKIFVWEQGRRWAVSSSLNDLVSFLRQHEIPVKKSIENAGLLGFVGYGGGPVPTPYYGIDCVDQFHFVEASDDGKLHQVEYSFKKELLGVGASNGVSHQQLLEEVAGQIRSNVATFSSYHADSYICQLTGGLDSRTVFAALVGTPYREQFSTYTYGLDKSPDMVIARQLTAEYGLSATEYSGMRSAIVPHDPSLRVLWSLKQTGGLTSMGPASIGGYPRPDSVVLAGGWGEMYRGGYPDYPDVDSTDEDKIKWTVNWVLRSGSPYGSRISYGGLFSDSMIERAREYGTRMLREVRELGIGDEFLAEWMYLRWSTRFNVAEITRTCSPFTHRVDPLCVPSMMKLIFATPFEDRKSGALEMDLIRTLCPGLERFPYDKNYLTENYKNSRGIDGLRNFDESISPNMKWHFDDNAASLTSTMKSTRPTESHKKEALRVKMPLRFIVRAEENRRKLAGFVRERRGEMEKVFNLEHLKNLTESNPRSRPEYRRLETLSAALDWYFDKE